MSADLKRSLRPSLRSTRAIVAGLDERHARIGGVQEKEWRELRHRIADALARNAAGECSAADVVASLYLSGLDVTR